MRISDWSSDVCSSDLAYSLLWVMPIVSVITAPTIAACQPQNTNRVSLSEISRTWQVRWTTYSAVANSNEPPNTTITQFVCSGRSRAQLSHGMQKLSADRKSVV